MMCLHGARTAWYYPCVCDDEEPILTASIRGASKTSISFWRKNIKHTIGAHRSGSARVTTVKDGWERAGRPQGRADPDAPTTKKTEDRHKSHFNRAK